MVTAGSVLSVRWTGLSALGPAGRRNWPDRDGPAPAGRKEQLRVVMGAAVILAACVTLAQLSNLSEPQLPHP